MIRAYIGLGSNQSHPYRQLRRAIKTIASAPDITLCRASSLYRSKPVGPQNQADFINAVVAINTGLEADSLLDKLQAIEARQGRVRAEHWGPRSLDLDILLYGRQQINNERLTIPHAEMKNRNFVLIPLVEIARDLDIPGLGSVAALLQDCGDADIQKIE